MKNTMGHWVPDLQGRDCDGVRDVEPLTVSEKGEFLVGRNSPESETLSDVALSLVDGDRQADYGDPVENMRRIGECWRAAFGWDASPRHVALAMIFVKAVREANKPKQDNRVDLHGYTDVLDRCVEAEGA